MPECLSRYDPDNLWTYCPSLPASVVLAVAFLVTTSIHIFQAKRYKTTFLWALIMGSIWESLSFIIRCASIYYPKSEGLFNPHFLLFLLAPLWINAFDYMLLGRLVYYYLPEKKIYGVRAQRMAIWFVCLDVASFAVQIVGGLLTLSKNFNTLQNGLRIYTAGVALQQFFIVCFLFLVVSFHRRVLREVDGEKLKGAKKLLIVLYVSLTLISFRIIFRLVEFSAGAGTKLTDEFRRNEWYQYAFDAVPMFLALLAMNIIHPGTVIDGDKSRFVKVTKEEKRARKAESKERKAARKEGRELGSISRARDSDEGVKSGGSAV